MFKLLDGYFKRIPCPAVVRNTTCTILGCIFQHNTSGSVPEKRPLETELVPDSKKIKLDLVSGNLDKVSSVVPATLSVEEPDVSFILPQEISHVSIARSVRIANVLKIIESLGDHPHPKKQALKIELDIALNSKSAAQYDEKIAKSLIKVDKAIDPQFILPTQVNGAPATLPARKKVIQLIVDSIKKNYPHITTPILRATEEEYKIASTTTSFAYNQGIRNRLHEINNGKLERDVQKPTTEEEYYKYLCQYVIPVEKLEKFGYVVTPPQAVEPKKDKICKRCNNPFNIDDQLTPTECHYHAGKIRRRDQNTRYYDCCGAVFGGDAGPCSFCKYHIFYWDNVQEMQWAIPFHNTKEWPINNDSFKAIGIDCEMGYTTRGFELLRITAIDFFSGEELLDLMVKPKGTVVDLNTRWSGVAEIGDDAVTFEDLMQLLGSVMDQNTILVGHGLENDLNSMRLIHERVVDTAILFPPHKATPTFRYSLKDLTFKYLSRNIQTGEHDSSEDSLAAIDITKYFINQKLNKATT